MQIIYTSYRKVNKQKILEKRASYYLSNKNYIVDASGITVKLTKTIAKKYVGQTMTIAINQHPGYTYTPATSIMPAQITFDVAYNNSVIEITSFYKHDILDIKRTSKNVKLTSSITPNTLEYYTHLKIFGKQLQLGYEISNDNYIWVIRNTTLLTAGIDFKLNDDKTSITLLSEPAINDEFTMITFNDNVSKIGRAHV